MLDGNRDHRLASGYLLITVMIMDRYEDGMTLTAYSTFASLSQQLTS